MGTRHRGPPPRALATLLLALPVGCSSGTHRERTAGAAADTVRATVAFTVGSGSSAEEYLFGDVTSVAGDGRGVLYVADRIDSSVRAFDADGAFLGWVGRKGEGPGEFFWPFDVLMAEDGVLQVRDARRVTSFARRSASDVADSAVATWPLPAYTDLESRRAQRVEGSYFYPSAIFPTDGPPRYFYARFDAGGLSGDTVDVPPLAHLSANRTASYMVNAHSGRMVEGLNVAPFEPRATWDMTSQGTIVGGDGTSVWLFSQAGDTLRKIDEGGGRPIPPGERRDSLRAVGVRLDALPVPVDKVRNLSEAIRADAYPTTLPGHVAVFVGEGDRIWIERWPSEGQGDARFFDVVDLEGTPLATVVVPAPLQVDPPPFFGTSRIYGVVRDPETAVESVVAATYRLLGGGG